MMGKKKYNCKMDCKIEEMNICTLINNWNYETNKRGMPWRNG